jgi:hypothetical protein
MVDIAAIGLKHLSDQLSGKMHHCIVSEWIDPETEQPVEIYWRPLTGAEQKQIEAGAGQVERIALTVKVRARDAGGRLLFGNTGLASLMHDYDFDVIRAIAYLITGDITDTDDAVEDAVKE